MTCTISPDQITALTAPLDRAKVRQREQGRSTVSYLEGWQVIAEANHIFGFDGWLFADNEVVRSATSSLAGGERSY